MGLFRWFKFRRTKSTDASARPSSTSTESYQPPPMAPVRPAPLVTPPPAEATRVEISSPPKKKASKGKPRAKRAAAIGKKK